MWLLFAYVVIGCSAQYPHKNARVQAFDDVARTCYSIWGYDQCEHFQRAVCAAREWQKQVRGRLMSPNPTVTVVGGTRPEWLENMATLRKMYADDPRLWRLRTYKESPLVMRGCAGQYTQLIGNLDAFVSHLKTERVSISQDCMTRRGGPLHHKAGPGSLPARVDPMRMSEVFSRWNIGTPVPLVHWKKSGIRAHFGSVLNANDLTEPPLVSWAQADPGQRYALIMFDPDIPGHVELWHWVVSDIPGATLREQGEGGDIRRAGRERWTYIPPSPPQQTGLHRYVIALFEQRGPLRIQNLTGITPQDRIHERINLFLQTNPISMPRAVLVFNSEYNKKMVRL